MVGSRALLASSKQAGPQFFAFQLEEQWNTKNTPVIEQVGFIICCSERECSPWGNSEAYQQEDVRKKPGKRFSYSIVGVLGVGVEAVEPYSVLGAIRKQGQFYACVSQQLLSIGRTNYSEDKAAIDKKVRDVREGDVQYFTGCWVAQ